MKIKKELEKLKNKEKTKVLARYFKTGKGEYEEGDVFLGVTIPEQRKIARKYFKDTVFEEVQDLLNSKTHEHKMIATMILVFQISEAYKDNDNSHKYRIYDFYTNNFKSINNWDLVDNSASYIAGRFLVEEKQSLEILKKWADSGDLWTRRIAIISTHYLIKKDKKEYFYFILDLIKILIQDKHDLIHKALGWTLRELGKKDKDLLIRFLDENSKIMPRTTLRYSLERLNKKERLKYMKKP